MRFQALACDYDGTLATHGAVGDDVISSLKALRRSGRKLLMVTGRRLEELFTVFHHAALFDRIVAENGALLYRPATNEEVVLAEPPLPAFLELLHQRGVTPVEVGRVIVATWEPHETAVLAAIRDLGLGMQIILNKGAVMVLPADVSKATGLHRALDELCLSPHNVAGIGDAENDHALLTASECGVAVANAVEALKARADVVTTGDHGAGVAELINQLLRDDLISWTPRFNRHALTLGRKPDGSPYQVSPLDGPYHIVAKRPDGLFPWIKDFLNQLSQAGYQWALLTDVDRQKLFKSGVIPESEAIAPSIDDAEKSLKNPKLHAVLDCGDLPASARLAFVGELRMRFAELWKKVGRPHWIVWLDSAGLLDGVDLSADQGSPHGVVIAQSSSNRSLPSGVEAAVTFVEQGAARNERIAAVHEVVMFQATPDGLQFDAQAPSAALKPLSEILT